MHNKENVASETDHKMRKNLSVTNWNECDDGISERLYIRVRQGLFLALSDVVDAFVVSGKHQREQSKQNTQ